MFRVDVKKLIPSSLRHRYILLTTFLGLMILFTVLFFYSNVLINKQQLNNSIENTNFKREKLEIIHSNLFNLHRHIDFFLNDPLQGNYRETSQKLISASAKTAEELAQMLKNINSEQTTLAISSLELKLAELKGSVMNLFNIRMDIKHQYPGMSLSAIEMTPALLTVDGNFGLLRDEIVSEDFEPESKELYPALMNSNILWASQVSQIRIYLANRLASFSTDILSAQAQTYDNKHQEFNRSIDKLEKLYATEDSFDGVNLVASIKLHAEKWHKIFIQVRALSEQDTWRGDLYYKKTTFTPLIDQIITLIKQMDVDFILEQKSILKNLRNNTDTLTTLLITIIFLFLLFISLIIGSMNWMIFRPIAQVVNALKSTAFEGEVPKIMAANTSEIKPLIEAFTEMDDKVRRRTNDLEYQTLHDSLTGLPNRLMLNEIIDGQISFAEGKQQQFALFIIDLDHFKDVNDSLGHLTGDVLLKQVATRLKGQIGSSNMLARLGGDEFAIIFANTNKQQSEDLARQVNQIICETYVIDGQSIKIDLSIGIATYPKDGVDNTDLLKHADVAMYFCKKNRHCFSHYDSTEDVLFNRMQLISDLRKAIVSDELELYYQPQVNVNTKIINSAEALLRWNHPEHGFIRPDKIVELAEYDGIIHQLSLWVLNEALKNCNRWHQAGCQFSISVNLSVNDLLNQSLNIQISELLEKHQMQSQFLTIEVTESGMMDNPEPCIEMLGKLNKMGIKLSIDDFGTGFSSLAYLKKLPVHELKIDQSFIFNMDNDQSDAVIVKSTIDLGHNLGLKVLAEGVENERVMELITSFGCDEAQGYLFSKPLPYDDFCHLMKSK